MNYYKISDFNTAAILFTLGKKIHNFEGTMPRKIFIFEDDGTIDEIRIKLYRRELLIEPLAFIDAEKNLKKIIYGEV